MRYALMKRSDVKDNIIGDFYPDPLSLNYNRFILSGDLNKLEVDEEFLGKTWKFFSSYYGNVDVEDVILTLNRIPHKNFMEIGDPLYLPILEDLSF